MMMKYVKAVVLVLGAAVSIPLYASNSATVFDSAYVDGIKKKFEAMDVDGNGYITYEQTQELMPAIADQVEKIDLNRDGQITWHEVEFVYRSFNNSLGSRAQQQLHMMEQDKQMLEE